MPLKAHKEHRHPYLRRLSSLSNKGNSFGVRRFRDIMGEEIKIIIIINNCTGSPSGASDNTVGGGYRWEKVGGTG